MNYQQILEDVYQEIRPFEKDGKQADYIPALAQIDPDQFGVYLNILGGEHYSLGAYDTKFSIQSISKVFSLAIALSILGKDLWTRIGKEPSGSAFNSLVQLEYESGKPRNPFINAGAIVLADVLHLYCMMCSVEMSCKDLAQAFTAFARSNEPFSHAGVNLTVSRVKRINAIMQTCGFYDEAGEFAFLVGLPGKSGVGGGIVALYPSKYTIAVWSPRLNVRGNSIMGLKALELFTTLTTESIF